MESLNEIFKLFSNRFLENEKSGLSQSEFNLVATKLEKAGYAKVHKEETGRCIVIELNEYGLKKKQ